MQNNYDWLSGQFPVPSGLEQKTAEGIAQAFSKVQLTMEKTSFGVQLGLKLFSLSNQGLILGSKLNTLFQALLFTS